MLIVWNQPHELLKHLAVCPYSALALKSSPAPGSALQEGHPSAAMARRCVSAAPTGYPMFPPNLLHSLLSVYVQILDQRLPSQYVYHKVPAPFIQVRCGGTWLVQQ